MRKPPPIDGYHHLTTLQFVECDTCRAKPGSPVLCYACLLNRQIIDHLRTKMETIDASNAAANVIEPVHDMISPETIYGSALGEVATVRSVGPEPLKFVDISSEEWREYTFPGGQKIRITAPLYLHVTKKPGGDSHRIVSRQYHESLHKFENRSHYIPAGWIHLEWQSKPGLPPFAL